MVLFARALSVRVAVTGIVLSAATAFVASLLSAMLVVLVRAQVAPEGGYGGLRQAPLEALLTGFCGPLVLGLLRRIDGRIDMNRARVGLSSRGQRSSLGDGISIKDRRRCRVDDGSRSQLRAARRQCGRSRSNLVT